MRTTLALILIATTALAACSRHIPETPKSVAAGVNPLMPEKAKKKAPDTRTPVAHIDSARAEKLPGGIIVKVTATAAAQGSYDVALKNLDQAGPVNGVLHYALVANLPATAEGKLPPQGTPASRNVVAALRIDNIDLAGIRGIEVRGADNAISLRP